MTEDSHSASERVLRWPDVHRRTGICRSHAHALAAQCPPKFPKPIKLGLRASGWLESEIDAWLQQRIADSRRSGLTALLDAAPPLQAPSGIHNDRGGSR